MEELKTYVKSVFEKIEDINANDEYCYEKIFLLFRNLRFIPVILKPVFKDMVTFRARTHDEQSYFYDISEITCPPRKIIKSFGRLNRPYQSIFYSSENRPTSYMELIEWWAESKNKGDELIVTLGMWKLQRNINVAIIPNPNKVNRTTKEEKEIGFFYDIKKKEFSKEEQLISDLIFEYLFDKYSSPGKKDAKTYIITSAFTNLLLTKDEVEGLLYPSIPFQRQGYNLAFRRKIYELNDVILVQATKDTFRIGETKNGKHHFIQIDTKDSKLINYSAGKIIWY